MAFTPEGVEYPVQTDVFDPAGDMQQLAESIPGIIVPVANTADRDAYATANPGTETAPIYVDRADAPAGKRVEVNRGTGWLPISQEIVVERASGSPIFGTVPANTGPLVIVSGSAVVTTNTSGTALIAHNKNLACVLAINISSGDGAAVGSIARSQTFINGNGFDIKGPADVYVRVDYTVYGYRA